MKCEDCIHYEPSIATTESSFGVCKTNCTGYSRFTAKLSTHFGKADGFGDDLDRKADEEEGDGDICEVCGMHVDTGNAVSVEAPEEFAEQHISDNVRIVKVWHWPCFEKQFNIKLPTFGPELEVTAPFNVNIVEK